MIGRIENTLLLLWIVQSSHNVELDASEVKTSIDFTGQEDEQLEFQCDCKPCINEPGFLLKWRKDGEMILNMGKSGEHKLFDNKYQGRYNASWNNHIGLFVLTKISCSDEGRYECIFEMLSGTYSGYTVVAVPEQTNIPPSQPTMTLPAGPIPVPTSFIVQCHAEVGRPKRNMYLMIKLEDLNQFRPIKCPVTEGVYCPQEDSPINPVLQNYQGDCSYTTNATIYLKAEQSLHKAKIMCLVDTAANTSEVPSVSAASRRYLSQTVELDIEFPVIVDSIILYVKTEYSTLHIYHGSNNVSEGSKVIFQCIAKANPKPYMYKWIFTARDGVQKTLSSYSKPNFTLNNVKMSDAGVYTCTAYSKSGSNQEQTDTKRITLTVLQSAKYVQQSSRINEVEVFVPIIGSIVLMFSLVGVGVLHWHRTRAKAHHSTPTDHGETSTAVGIDNIVDLSDSGYLQPVESQQSESELDEIDSDLLYVKRTLSRINNPEIQEQVKHALIFPSRLHIDEKLLGQGNFGIVKKGLLFSEDKQISQHVAIKEMKTIDPGDTEEMVSFLQEGLLMIDFHHPNVLNVIGISIGKESNPMVIQPFMKQGDLKNYVSKKSNKKALGVVVLLDFAAQVASGMTYLVENNYVHRDLAARNCLLDDKNVVKVADFGLCRDVIAKGYYRVKHKDIKLPMRWLAPECLDQLVFSSASDVWSYGVLLWELLTYGQTPYKDVFNKMTIIHHLTDYLQSGQRLRKPDICPPTIFNDVLLKCWDIDPLKRPDFPQLEKQIKAVMTEMNPYKNMEAVEGRILLEMDI